MNNDKVANGDLNPAKKKWSEWTRNVTDEFKTVSTEEIKQTLKSRAHSFAVLMEQWQGDFNFSTLIRNANAFNANEVYYIGKKRWDRRGTVGTHHYTDIKYLGNDLSGFENYMKLREKYCFVAIENNPINGRSTHDLRSYKWPKNALMIFGEEGDGISLPTLAIVDDVVKIPQFGSVRSLNVGTASGIIMNSWCEQHA
jgi:tRNA G18 (ribose-2'-O)-methylase SpoU